MKEEVIIDTLKRGKSIHEEQQALWEAMDELWPPGKYEEEQKNYCLHDEVDDFIIDKIASALKECNNNQTHTADKLGIKRETLLAKMRKYCLI